MRNTCSLRSLLGLAAIWLIAAHSAAQWQSLNGGVNRSVKDFEFNADSSKLLVIGGFPYVRMDSLRANGMAWWDGEQWSIEGLAGGNGSTLPYGIDNNVVSVANWHDTLFVGHGITGFQNHSEWNYGAGLDLAAQEWFPIGNPENWFYVFEANGRLFCGGRSDTLYGEFAPGIKEWRGGAWGPVPGSPFTGPTGTFYDCAYWQNQYWFAGSFLSDGCRSVIGYDGDSTWTPTYAPGGWINAIAGFGDSLYAGGWFTESSASYSPMLSLYDGAEWNPFFPGEVSYFSQVYDVETYNGALYVSGLFTFVGDTVQYGLLRYDGHELCAIGGVMADGGDNGQIAFFQDHLYLAMATGFPGFVYEFIGRLPLDGLVPDRCVAVTTGIHEASIQSGSLQFVPNPTHTSAQLILPKEFTGAGTISIYSTLGQLVHESRATVGTTISLDLRGMAPGLYHVVAQNETQRLAGKLVID
jgi:Secretion system C-terminal sorting domain